MKFKVLVPLRPLVLKTGPRKKFPQFEFWMQALGNGRTNTDSAPRGKDRCSGPSYRVAGGDFCTSLKMAFAGKGRPKASPGSGKEGTHALSKY